VSGAGLATQSIMVGDKLDPTPNITRASGICSPRTGWDRRMENAEEETQW
jgi:hypothetical protein